MKNPVPTCTSSDLHWIPCNLGLQIGGTPVGSFDVMVESVYKTVDAIVSELQQFERYLHGANGMLRARVQTIFAMIRQCISQQLTHLLTGKVSDPESLFDTPG